MIGYGGRTRWTQAELRSAPPAVVDAARWELYASELWPGTEVVASLDAPLDPPPKTTIMRERVAMRAIIERIRRMLLPPDEAP